MPETKQLGRRQKELLAALQGRGAMSPGDRETRLVLDSLVTRGLARLEAAGAYRPAGASAAERFVRIVGRARGFGVRADRDGRWSWYETDDGGGVLGAVHGPFAGFGACLSDAEAALRPADEALLETLRGIEAAGMLQRAAVRLLERDRAICRRLEDALPAGRLILGQ